ncbi:MAG: sigma 54-interacting transcriptional regulator, partial [Rhodospirillales bacterium]|nr:sigma 54-interacting transcriptional regulator [Rhodospirillales bacterium]
MRVLIIGSLAGELGQAAQIADVAQDVGAVVAALAAERMAVPVVAAGTGDDPEAVLRAIRAGAREFLPLPPDPDLIAAILEAASGESHALVVRDPVMATLVRRAEQVARSEASVLICGESGTGKEVLARHIHRRSRRAGGPFVALNCAAIPENLLESELFGHEKGAFSGALARRVGKFEAADHGTLLLDEISEMDVRLQAKLLRALQEREIDRLGGAAPVKVDVRILATSNRDLLAAVARGTFREDLYYRLNVVALRVPSLRERPG